MAHEARRVRPAAGNEGKAMQNRPPDPSAHSVHAARDIRRQPVFSVFATVVPGVSAVLAPAVFCAGGKGVRR